MPWFVILALCSDEYNVSVSEDTIPGQQVVRIIATDGDLDVITYTLIDEDEVSNTVYVTTTKDVPIMQYY